MDLLANEFAVAMAQAMDGYGHSARSHLHRGGGCGVIAKAAFGGEESFQGLKELGFAALDVFLFHAGERALEQRFSPAALKDFLRRKVRRRLGEIAVLGGLLIKADDGVAAAALDGVGMPVGVDEEAVYGDEREGGGFGQ